MSRAGVGARIAGRRSRPDRRSARLLAYLIREARALLEIGALLDRPDVAGLITPRLDALIAALEEFWDEARGIYTYRDRDAHACPYSETIFSGHGESVLAERIELGQPGRLILRAAGGLIVPALSCTVEVPEIRPLRCPAGVRLVLARARLRRAPSGGCHGAASPAELRLGVGGARLTCPRTTSPLCCWSGALDERRLVAHLTDPAAQRPSARRLPC